MRIYTDILEDTLATICTKTLETALRDKDGLTRQLIEDVGKNDACQRITELKRNLQDALRNEVKTSRVEYSIGSAGHSLIAASTFALGFAGSPAGYAGILIGGLIGAGISVYLMKSRAGRELTPREKRIEYKAYMRLPNDCFSYACQKAITNVTNYTRDAEALFPNVMKRTIEQQCDGAGLGSLLTLLEGASEKGFSRKVREKFRKKILEFAPNEVLHSTVHVPPSTQLQDRRIFYEGLVSALIGIAAYRLTHTTEAMIALGTAAGLGTHFILGTFDHRLRTKEEERGVTEAFLRISARTYLRAFHTCILGYKGLLEKRGYQQQVKTYLLNAEKKIERSE